jgi:hypothetical protein
MGDGKFTLTFPASPNKAERTAPAKRCVAKHGGNAQKKNPIRSLPTPNPGKGSPCMRCGMVVNVRETRWTDA